MLQLELQTEQIFKTKLWVQKIQNHRLYATKMLLKEVSKIIKGKQKTICLQIAN